MKVEETTGKMSGELKLEFARLLCSCFNRHDLDWLCMLNLDARNMDEIVTNGPLRAMAADLITWCEDEKKLHALINAVIKERPFRAGDIESLVQRLADAGVVRLA